LQVELIDQDELQAANNAGLERDEQVRASYSVAENIRAELLTGTFAPLRSARDYLALNISG
jgi:predicted RNA-binding protein associated with RNAse of E/G family